MLSLTASRFALLTWLLLVGVQSACALTVRVPGDEPTIQAGLNSLQDGDTVLIALGTYAESLIAPDLRFTMKGDVVPDTGEYARPVIDPSTLPGADSINCLTLPWNSHPVIEDLTFRNGAAMYPHLFSDGGITCYARDPVLRRVVMDSVVWALHQQTVFDSTAVITLDSCDFRHIFDRGVLATWRVIATDCRFSQNGATLIYCLSHSFIIRCRFESDGPLPDERALHCQYGDVLVQDCVFHGSVEVYPPRPNVVIDGNLFDHIVGNLSPLRIQYDAGPGVINAVIVTGNVFSECNTIPPALSAGIEMEAYIDTTVLVPRYARIFDNVFVSCQATESPGAANATRLCNAAEIFDNRFFHLDPHTLPALRLYSRAPADTAVILRRNLILDTGTALENDTPLEPDARWNWWGDSTGPYHAQQNPFGQGDTVIGNVAVTPWYPDTSFLSVSGPGRPLPDAFVLSAYPNPFNSILHLTLVPSHARIVKLELFDVLGQRVSEVWRGPLAFQKVLNYDASGLSSGLYFARVTDVIDRRPLATAKLVLLK